MARRGLKTAVRVAAYAAPAVLFLVMFLAGVNGLVSKADVWVGVLIIGVLLVPLLLILALVLLILKRRRAALLPGICVAAIAASHVTAMSVMHWQERVSIARGDAVIAALESYKIKSGQYPADLEALVPTWLSAVPRPAMGFWRDARFRFDVADDGQSFSLRFDSGVMMVVEYDAREKAWTSHD